MALENSKLETKLATLSDRPIPDAPVFRPTAAQFRDPLRYVASIRREAEPFGICKIVPPRSWRGRVCCGLEFHKEFATKRQRIHELGEADDDDREYTLEEYRRMADAFYARRIRSTPTSKETRTETLGRTRAIVDQAGRSRCRIWQRHRRERILEWLPAGVGIDQLSGKNLPQSVEDPSYVKQSGWNLNNTALARFFVERHDAPTGRDAAVVTWACCSRRSVVRLEK